MHKRPIFHVHQMSGVGPERVADYCAPPRPRPSEHMSAGSCVAPGLSPPDARKGRCCLVASRGTAGPWL